MDAKTFLPGFTERWSEARGVRLRWFEGGSGPTVALVHGYGGAASNWVLVAPRLAERLVAATGADKFFALLVERSGRSAPSQPPP